MTNKTLIVDEIDGVLGIRLDRPASYNAIDVTMIDELHEVLLAAERSRSIRAVSLTGTGKAFCSGGDVKSFAKAFASGDPGSLFHMMPTRLHDMLITMKRLDKPVVGLINGPAVGAGFPLAAACDLLVAAETAYFALGYLKLGLSPDGGSTFFLPRSLGAHKTFELLALGKSLSAAEAKSLGLVAEVFPDHTFQAQALDVVRAIAALPTRAAAAAKRLIFESMEHSIDAQLARETAHVKQTASSKDFFEGVSAFVEKRPPRFRGE